MAIAINNKNLFNYFQLATIDDEVEKSNSIYDLVNYHNIDKWNLKQELIRCLLLMNAKLHVNRKLDDFMIEEIAKTIIEDYNTITPVGFMRAIKKGINGEYGQVYAMDFHTVISWVLRYLSGEEESKRIELYRRSREIQQQDEIHDTTNFVKAMKEALQISGPKVREFVPNKKHLELFKQAVKLYKDEELRQAKNDWSKRQRPQYLEIIESEIQRRIDK